jgi:hypothetical protein
VCTRHFDEHFRRLPAGIDERPVVVLAQGSGSAGGSRHWSLVQRRALLGLPTAHPACAMSCNCTLRAMTLESRVSRAQAGMCECRRWSELRGSRKGQPGTHRSRGRAHPPAISAASGAASGSKAMAPATLIDRNRRHPCRKYGNAAALVGPAQVSPVIRRTVGGARGEILGTGMERTTEPSLSPQRDGAGAGLRAPRGQRWRRRRHVRHRQDESPLR